MGSVKKPRVMLVDDHAIMRDGLREVLGQSGEFEMVGEAADGAAGVRMAQCLSPDVIIMDVIMPVKNGIEACREIKDALPGVKVLMLTASGEEAAVVEAIAAGATGYLQKYSGKDELLRAVRDVARGEYRIPTRVIRRVFAGIRNVEEWRKSDQRGSLTDREREILRLFSRGKSYAEIAEIRGNRPLTIRNAIYGIQNKLGIETKQGLVVWAVRNGLLDDQRIKG